MTAIQFYHLTATPLERALPKLLEKVFTGGFKAQVLAGSDEQVDRLDQLLWTYTPLSFLPHGRVKDGQVERQPILLATDIQANHPANLLVVTDGRATETKNFDRVLDIFDGQDPQAVASARTRWTAYKNAGHEVSYLKQNDQGGWEKAA